MRQLPRILLIICLLVSSSAFAASTASSSSSESNALQAKSQDGEAVDARRQALIAKTQSLKQTNKNAKKQLIELQTRQHKLQDKITPEKVTQKALDHALLDVGLAAANYDSASISQTEAEQMIDTTTLTIDGLENELRMTTLSAGRAKAVQPRLTNLQLQLDYQRKVLNLEEQLSSEATRYSDTSKQVLQLEKDWRLQLESVFQNKLQIQRQQQLFAKEQQLIAEQVKWQQKVEELNQQISEIDSDATDSMNQRNRLELKVFEAQEHSNLLHVEVVVARLANQFSVLKELREKEATVATLNAQSHQASVLQNESQKISDLLKRKIGYFSKRLDMELMCRNNCVISTVEFQEGKKLIGNMLDSYHEMLVKVSKVGERLTEEQEAIQRDLTKALSRRQGLPGLDLSAWTSLIHKSLAMPILALPVLKALGTQMKTAFEQLNTWQLLKIILLEFVLLGVWYYLHQLLSRALSAGQEGRQSISANIWFVVLRLLWRNLDGLVIFSAFLLLFWLIAIPFKSFLFIVYLVLVWFVFKIALGVAHITLLETTADISGRDVKLYRSFKWVLVTGGVLTMLTVLAHQLPVEYAVSDFFNRLFMLFLLLISILLLRGWRIVPNLLLPFSEGARPYFMRVVRLLSLLIPLTIFSAAIIGLFGYVDLAWEISKYEGLFLLVLSGYVILRGFLNDFMEWLSEFAIRRMRNGWLWTQAVLRPLDRVLRVVLFVAAVVTLFMLYGWGRDSVVVQALGAALHVNLISYDNTEFTPLGIIEFIVAGIVLVWVARWTREFSYRWLFARTHDIGLRNSLAAFTQYTTVTIGLLIALKIIGIDLSGLNYILTALAFGIGFGLRDLAKNYVSGILMLIERPVRAGDLLSVGDYEGEVTHIGMRALTVKTWDHMEVLVPNSEVFEKPVTNWTHQDSIVRTVISIKIKREDDLNIVKQLILEVLDRNNDVVTDPAPHVFLKDIDDVLIAFEARYFINLQLGYRRARVRSEVLFQIWEIFKQHGIKSPNPEQDIYLKNLPVDKKPD